MENNNTDRKQPVRLTWRKGKIRSGMMRLPETYHLYQGNKRLAGCQRLESGNWFWYSRAKNTAFTPTDLETAKREAKAYVKEQISLGTYEEI